MNTDSKLNAAVSPADNSKGPAHAPIVLVEYADFECPYCRDAYTMLNRLEEDFGKNLKIIFRNFPLSEIHPDAINAAKAVEAAALQDQFWEMHDLIFENQDELSLDALFSYAAELGLNMKTFARDFQGEDVAEKIDNDLLGGEQSGVDGTPTFFINGVKLDIGGDEEALHHEIQSLLTARSPSGRSQSDLHQPRI